MIQASTIAPDEVRELYLSDVAEKKATAMGGKNKISRSGVSFYSDMLRGKAKKEYMKAGELTISSPYDRITPYEDFKAFPTDKKKVALSELLKRHSVKDIAETWGTPRSTVDNYVYRFGMSKGTTKVNNTKPEAPQKALTTREVEEIFAYVLSIRFAEGSITGEEIAQKVKALSHLFIPGHEYQLTLSLKENFD